MRERIEAALGQWGRFVAAHAYAVIFVVVLATGLLLTQMQHFRFDTSSEGYFHRDDPVRVQAEEFQAMFGRDTRVVISLTPEAGIFDRAFLETLRSMHDEIEAEVPYLVEVLSLLNVRETVGTEDGLEVGDLLEDWPETDAALRELEARARANPLYRGNLISPDGRSTLISIETDAYAEEAAGDDFSGFEEEEAEAPVADVGFDRRPMITGAQDTEIAMALDAIVKRHEHEGLVVHVAGMPAFSAILAERMGEDMGKFAGLSIAIIAGLLALLFRRAAAVFLPLLTVVLSVLATLSLMAATDTPMMPPSQTIPSFLLAVGIGGAVHLLAIFYQGLRSGMDKVGAISHALSHSGLAIVMTSLTTAGGLLSFIPAALRPISHFGAFTPIGVLLSLFFVLTLLPALLAVFPTRAAKARGDDTPSQRLLVGTGLASSRNPVLVLGVWALIIVGSVVGATRIHMGHHMLEWFPHGDTMYKAMTYLNDEFGGAGSYEMYIQTGKENGLHEPELLRNIEQVQDLATEFEHRGLVGAKVLSIVDVVKETHQALNENRDEFYVVPDDKTLIAQELLLFENSGSDDVEDLVTPQFDAARLTVRVPFVDGAFFQPYIDRLLPQAQEILGPDVKVQITGMFRLFGNTIAAALDTMVKSYSTALVVITVLMIVLIGNLRMGLLSMIPNLVPVVFTLGVMGWLSIPLDMFTLMIGTIVIGLAVDDTIHFMHNFRRDHEKTGSVEAAVTSTLRTTGQALLFTSCVLALGFLVYTQAYMSHLWSFGVLAGGAITVAFLADLTLAPALVTLAAKRVEAPAGERAAA